MGAEIAIRGQISGRKKYSKYLHTIPYRSHSDFELYAVPKDFLYTEDFKDLFGAQEVYEETRSKMFGRTDNNRNPVPVGYLKDSSEITVLDGINIKTLNLEFLFADKLISEHYEFNKPNNHGRDISDSACIALLYDLDRDKIKKIINDFYIQPQREFILSNVSEENLKKRASILLKKIQREFAPDDRYIPSITSYSQAISSQELNNLYEDESKWDNGKLKGEEALKIIELDLNIYIKNMGGKLEELSPENIFKKIDSFFLNVEEQRKKIDNDMCKTSKLNSEIKRIKQKIN